MSSFGGRGGPVVWLAAVAGLAGAACAGADAKGEAKAVAAIKKLGGKVIVDDELPGKPIVKVTFYWAGVGSDDLTHLAGLTTVRRLNLSWNTRIRSDGLRHLKKLTRLEELSLRRTGVGDAGMDHLRGLARLKSLDLSYTDVGDVGLRDLTGLTELRELNLSRSDVTDAGLEHLKKLKGLREVQLFLTKTTPKGARELQKALPKLKVLR
jgi:hypothetical protein